MTDTEHSGVWVSEKPLDANEGAWGDTLLKISVDADEAALSEYEWLEDGKTYREWVVPAELLNRLGTVELANESEL